MTWSDTIQKAGLDAEGLYRDYMLLSLHGQSKDALAKTQAGAWEYDVVAPYYKCNMTDIMAAIGLVQLERYPEILERRKKIIGMYDVGLGQSPVQVLTHYGEHHQSSGHLYLVRALDNHVKSVTILSQNWQKLELHPMSTTNHFRC